jgi:radical SAM protein with 4Fe4S-binding SPASM domain
VCRRWEIMALLKSKKKVILQHFLGEGELSKHRFHLRSDSKKDGVLIVDASKIIHLNGTALDFTRYFLEGLSEKQIVKKIRGKYKKAKKEEVLKDYQSFKSKLIGVINDDKKVVSGIKVEPMDSTSLVLFAPYRMDLALTYKCQNSCCHCYNEPNRKVNELSFEKWTEIIDKLWNVGVPHIVFTGGEPTLVGHLPNLISHAEKNGQITGLITNGRKLSDTSYLDSLISAGLDHVQITLESFNSKTHDEITGTSGSWNETVSGIKKALAKDIYVSTNTTVLQKNLSEVTETIRFLGGLGVKNIALNSLIRSGSGKEAKGVTLEELNILLPEVKEIADSEKLNLVWYTPTPYCELNPVNMDLGIKQCTACSINMAVEPNADVLPCQSYYEPLGNLLKDPWEGIWNKPLCEKIRTRSFAPEKCSSCKLLEVCGGACPLSWKAGDYICLDKSSSG